MIIVLLHVFLSCFHFLFIFQFLVCVVLGLFHFSLKKRTHSTTKQINQAEKRGFDWMRSSDLILLLFYEYSFMMKSMSENEKLKKKKKKKNRPLFFFLYFARFTPFLGFSDVILLLTYRRKRKGICFSLRECFWSFLFLFQRHWVNFHSI